VNSYILQKANCHQFAFSFKLRQIIICKQIISLFHLNSIIFLFEIHPQAKNSAYAYHAIILLIKKIIFGYCLLQYFEKYYKVS